MVLLVSAWLGQSLLSRPLVSVEVVVAGVVPSSRLLLVGSKGCVVGPRRHRIPCCGSLWVCR